MVYVDTDYRKIPGYPYKINCNGDMLRILADGTTKPRRATVGNTGYRMVSFCKNGKKSYFNVHRLIAIVFIGPPPFPGAIVRHKDGDRTHDHPDNLQWGTYQDNADDRRKHGNTKAGETHYRALFTQQQVNDIRTRFQEHITTRQKFGFSRAKRGFLQGLADEFGVKLATMVRVIRKGYADG